MERSPNLRFALPAFKVIGAGNQEFDGTYRWFHVLKSFVKFESHGTYTLVSEMSGIGKLWHLNKMNAANQPERFYSGYAEGDVLPKDWECVLGNLPSPRILVDPAF